MNSAPKVRQRTSGWLRRSIASRRTRAGEKVDIRVLSGRQARPRAITLRLSAKQPGYVNRRLVRYLNRRFGCGQTRRGGSFPQATGATRYPEAQVGQRG
jgi:hypothetical protein